jgi:glycosyltransferase involved in cell wall biosynthesis
MKVDWNGWMPWPMTGFASYLRLRPAGLEAARGDFLAFLDADDWMLPDRLERQVGMLEADHDLALVSAGMFVLDEAEQPVGLRRVPAWAGTVQTALPDIVDSPVLSASSMIRGEIARRTAYDTDFTSGEDADFLVRCLRGRRYLQQDMPLYCYREYASFSMPGLRLGLAAERRRRLKHAASAPGRVMCWGRWATKRVLYEIAVAVRGRAYVLRWRCRQPTPEQLADWNSAVMKVETQVEQLRR